MEDLIILKNRSYLYLFVCLIWSLLISIILSSIGHTVSAQGNSVLRVLVISEEDGNPVISAHVMLLSLTGEGEGGEIQYAGVTDNDGFHEFRNVESGSYRLRVTFVGHATHEETIDMEDGGRSVKRISLSRSVEQFDEVIVEAEREVTTGEVGVRRITDIEVARIPTPGPGGDLSSYLQSLPGVVTTGDRGGDLHIRGGTPSQNRVLVDNIPVIKPFHISNLYSAFPQEIIQNIDLYAGGFGAEYMGATSAIIDVNLRPGNMRKTTGSGAVSPYLFSVQMEGPLKNNSESYMFMGRKSTIEWTAPHISSDEAPINFYDVVGRYSYQGENFTCNVSGMRTGDRGQINPNRDVRLSWANTVLGARCLGFDEIYPHPFEFTFGYSGFTNTEGTKDADERSSAYNQAFVRVKHQEEVFGHLFDYGFELNFHFISAELAERFTSYESFSQVTSIFNVYTSTEWFSSKNFTAKTGLGSQLAFGAIPTLEPRIRLAWQPDGTTDQEVSLAAGRYYQLMTGINDERDAGTVFNVWIPSEGGEPLQSALHGILGYQQRIGEYFQANIEGYVKKHRNIPVSKWTPIAKLEIETARANGFTYGFDARLEYDRGPLYLFLGYGWSKVEYEAASGDLGAWVEEPVFSYSPVHDQRHKLSTVGSYTLAGYTTSVRWELGSGKPYTQVYGFDLGLNLPDQHPLSDAGTARTLFSRPYGKRLPYYHRLDVSIKKSFDITGQISLETKTGVINVYNRNNVFYFDSNTLERVDQTPLLPYVSIKTNFN